MFGLFSIVSKYLSGGVVSFEDGGTLKIEKEPNGKYYWTFSFVSGRVEKSFDGFDTPAEAKKDFQYRSRYFVNGGNVSVDGGRDGDWLEDKFANGGELKEGDYIWNAVGKKLIVDKVTKDEYYLVGFGQPFASPFLKEKVNKYLADGEWSAKPKYENGGSLSEDMQMAKSDVMKLDEYAKKISDNISPEQDVEAWVISKVAKVEQTVANVKHTLEVKYPEKFAEGGGIEHTDGNTVRMMCLHIGKYAKSMLNAIENGIELDSWMKHELSIAGEDIDSVYHYLDYFNSGNHLEQGGGVNMIISIYEFYHDKDGREIGRLIKQGVYSDERLKKYIDSAREATFRKFDDGRYDYKQEVYVHPKGAKEPYNDKYKKFAEGGEVVKHLDIPNTMLDFTLKPKMENGGSAKKVKTIAPEHTCFVVVGSHRAMDKVRSIFEGKNVPYITLWSVSAKKSAATVVINIFERNYNLIERIKGVGKPSYALLSETKWHSRGESEVLDEKFKMVNDDEVYNTKQYQLGDKYSEDFDYEGMLNTALGVNVEWSIEDLNKLHDSFEDVNYSIAAAPLWEAIKQLESGNKNLGAAYLIIFKGKVRKEISGEGGSDSKEVFKNGGTLAQRRKVGKVMHEFKHGKLISHGNVVTDRNQAIAIALSEAGLSKKEEGGMIESFKLPSTDFVPITNGGIPSYNTPLDHWELQYEKGGKIKN